MSAQKKYYNINSKSKKESIILPYSGLIFKDKTSLKEYLVELANTILDEDIMPDHKHYSFFRDMIDRHYECKFEEGMNFKITTKEGYNLNRSKERTPWRRTEPYRCYVFVPSLNDYRSFSLFNKCVNGRNDSPQVLKTKAYRSAIESQITLFRRLKSWSCELCCSDKMLDVDHYPISFRQLVVDYEASTDEPTILGFDYYHRKNASLRLLCKQCHIRYGLKR